MSSFMPIVLMQRTWRDDPQYKDTEFVIFNFPRRYFDEIRGGERFVYYTQYLEIGECSSK